MMHSNKSVPTVNIGRRAKGKQKLDWPQWLTNRLEILEPPEIMTVSAWADKYRVLDGRSSAEPGNWNTNKTPYLRGIMDAFCDVDVEEITFAKGSQIGGTEAEYNMLGYAIDQDPGPALLVYPTDKLAEFSSENRIEPMIYKSPVLAEKYNKRASEKLELQLTDMYVALVGANSPSNLASRPVRYVFFDEIDKFPKWTGGEANPISLAMERTKTFHNRKIVKISTPTLVSGNIWQSYLAADVKYKYYVPCPQCGCSQELLFKQIKWPTGADGQSVRGAAWYECSDCGAALYDKDKMPMLRAGQWVTKDTVPEGLRSVAFHLSSLYSSWLTFGDVAAQFLKSKEYPELLMNFINSWLAEPWEQKSSKLRSDVVLAKQWTHERARVPEEAQLLTMGVDVQLNHFWWTVRAWGPDLTSWLVDYGRAETWTAIDGMIQRMYVTTQGEIRQLNLACIDSGYNTDEVYQFCARNPGICLPTKGSSHAMTSRYRVTILDKGVGYGLRLYLFDSGQMKDFIAGRLTYEPGTPGAWHVFAGCERAYADQICAEQKVEVKTGARITYEWQKISSHAQNHFLDCETNNTLAAEILGVRYLQKEAVLPPTPEPSLPDGNTWLGDTGNWIKR
jgi:phage terminase large subunit GpA-like protein